MLTMDKKVFNREIVTLSDKWGESYLLDSLPTEVYSSLDNLVEELKTSSNLTPYNYGLSGQLDKEFLIDYSSNITNYIKKAMIYYIKNNQNWFYRLLEPFVKEITPHLNFTFPYKHWVNFQAKHEYNPQHAHSGLLSYVIWHKIPYKIEDEIKKGPGKAKLIDNKQTNFNGCFTFSTATDGMIKHQFLEVDKTWNGTIAIFPSSLHHNVYPFYSSDDYRITFSGNLFLDLKK